MARVFLVNPPTDETVRTPLLSFLYLAAALRRSGHEVRCSTQRRPTRARPRRDRLALLALRRGPRRDPLQDALRPGGLRAAALVPGATATRWSAAAPHPTVAPLEPAARGFDFWSAAKGKRRSPSCAMRWTGSGAFGEVRSLVLAGGAAVTLRAGSCSISTLSRPRGCLDLFDPACTAAREPVGPAGCSPGRGCPRRAPSVPTT